MNWSKIEKGAIKLLQDHLSQLTKYHKCELCDDVADKGNEKVEFLPGQGTYPFFFDSQVDQFFKNMRHFDLLWIVGRKPAKPLEKENPFNSNNVTEVY